VRRRRGSAAAAVALIVIAIILWVTSLASQGFMGIASAVCEGWSSMAWVERGAAILLTAGFILLVLGAIVRRLGGSAALAALGVILLIAGIVAYVFAYAAVASDSPSKIEVVRLRKPLDMLTTRLIPLHTAYAYATSMLQTPTHTIYEDETYVYYDREGNIVFNWIIEPEGFWNEISREPLGVVLVNGSIYPPKVLIIKHKMVWGLHRLILTPFYVDTLWREIKLRVGPAVRVLMSCNAEVVRNGVPYILIPIASWEVGATTSVPVPLGFAVVAPNGSIRVVSFKQALHNPLFRGVPLVPEVVAREWVMIYRYYTGFWNVVLYHNTFTIRNVGSNPQPYLMIGPHHHLYWVFVAEPPGTTYAARYIMYVNASDPNPHILIYKLPKPVIGISRVASFIKQKHPRYDWSQFTIEEPMPVILNGTLYWKAVVTTKDGRGLISIDFINASSGRVISIEPNGTITMKEVLKYVLTGSMGNVSKAAKAGGIKGIIAKIGELKKKILQQEEELRKLYQELSSLQNQLERLLANRTSVTATHTHSPAGG